MAKRTQGLNDDDAPASAPAQSPAPTSSGLRTKGLNDEPATVPTLPKTTAPAQPDPHAYTPPDWIPGADFLYKTNRIFENALTGGTADYLTAKAGDLARRFGIQNTTPDVAQLRAETEQNRKDVGPVASTAADIAGYTMGPGRVLGPLGKGVAPTIGRYGGAALEGATASGLNSVGGQLGGDIDPYKTIKDTALGGAVGAGSQAVGDITGAAVRRVADYVTGKPGRGASNIPLEAIRSRANAGEDVRPDIVAQQVFKATPGSPEEAAFRNINRALGQSTAPGYVAGGVKNAAAAAAGGLGLQGQGWLGGLFGASTAKQLAPWIVDPLAKGINTIDRRINVNRAFDELYPAMGPNRVTTNVEPWADAIRQLAIGGSR